MRPIAPGQEGTASFHLEPGSSPDGTIVICALLRIAQCVICVEYLSELDVGVLFVALVHVRMILEALRTKG